MAGGMDWGSAFAGAFSGGGSGYDFGSKDADSIGSGSSGSKSVGSVGKTLNINVPDVFGNNKNNMMPFAILGGAVIIGALLMRGK